MLIHIYFNVVININKNTQTQDGNPYSIISFPENFAQSVIDTIQDSDNIPQPEKDHLIKLIQRWDTYVKKGGTAQNYEW